MGSESNKIEYLVQELENKIKVFKEHSTKHKNIYRVARYFIYLLTASLSILAGLALYYPQSSALINISILILSAVVGLLTSYESLRKADALWVHERTIQYQLTDLKRELLFESAGSNLEPPVLRQYFDKLQVILGNSGKTWSDDIIEKDKEEN